MRLLSYQCNSCGAVIQDSVYLLSIEKVNDPDNGVLDKENPYPFEAELENVHLCRECAERIVGEAAAIEDFVDNSIGEDTDEQKAIENGEEVSDEEAEAPAIEDVEEKVVPVVRGRKVTNEAIGKMLALHQAGWKGKDIAGELGISQGAVSGYIRKYGTVKRFHKMEGIEEES